VPLREAAAVDDAPPELEVVADQAASSAVLISMLRIAAGEVCGRAAS
jgi:hypothetical protein